MSSLIVLLPLAPIGTSTELAYALTDGRTVSRHGTTVAALLPEVRGAGGEVIAVVPAHALSWHRVDLPKGISAGSPRLRAALEGLLEEQLLDDPEALHLALQPNAPAGEPVWVAVCDRSWLRQAMHALEAAQRPANRIVPEFAPQGPLRLYALGEPEDATLVCSGEPGVWVLPLASTSLALLPPLAEDTPVFAEPAVAALAEQVLPHPPQLQQTALRWLEAARSEWDLAQFEFASSTRARALKKLAAGWSDLLRAPQWRAARWGAIVLILANVLGLNAWAWRERAALDDKRQAMRAALTQTFPHVKVIVDAPVQMEREVAAMRQATGAASSRDLEAMLAALGSALPASRSVSALEYSANQLRVRGVTLTADETRAVTANLKGQGYGLTQQGDTLVMTAEDVR